MSERKHTTLLLLATFLVSDYVLLGDD